VLECVLYRYVYHVNVGIRSTFQNLCLDVTHHIPAPSCLAVRPPQPPCPVSGFPCVCMHACMYACMHADIPIEREHAQERERETWISVCILSTNRGPKFPQRTSREACTHTKMWVSSRTGSPWIRPSGGGDRLLKGVENDLCVRVCVCENVYISCIHVCVYDIYTYI
jgi:hypothetical protein